MKNSINFQPLFSYLLLFLYFSISLFIVYSFPQRYFRELPDPILTAQRFRQWMIVAGIEDEKDRFESAREVIASLPVANQKVLAKLVVFLNKVAQHSKDNKMVYKYAVFLLSIVSIYLHPLTFLFYSVYDRPPTIWQLSFVVIWSTHEMKHSPSCYSNLRWVTIQ